uniref:Uncharacterized protein n=1 Tax=Oryza brachyantha TaxID=4533 RepID=J3LR66_ORYBR
MRGLRSRILRTLQSFPDAPGLLLLPAPDAPPRAAVSGGEDVGENKENASPEVAPPRAKRMRACSPD